MASRDTTVLLDGLAFVESPRWHDDRLWFSHWGMEEILAVDLEGKWEVVGRGPAGLGWATEWLPDGRMLLTGPELLREEPDGTRVRHADLDAVAVGGCSEIVVDVNGNAYVNSINFDFMSGAQPSGPTGIVALVTPDGTARQVVDGIAFPNGMVITPDGSTLILSESFTGRLLAFDIAPDGDLVDRRVWAEGIGPDGICLDAEGCIWTHDPQARSAARVREGGEIVERIPIEKDLFATMLGGPDGQTLFLMLAEWAGVENAQAQMAKRTGEVRMVHVDVPHAGRP
jgi:sugar lactone lactonase YvrE